MPCCCSLPRCRLAVTALASERLNHAMAVESLYTLTDLGPDPVLKQPRLIRSLAGRMQKRWTGCRRGKTYLGTRALFEGRSGWQHEDQSVWRLANVGAGSNRAAIIAARLKKSCRPPLCFDFQKRCKKCWQY